MEHHERAVYATQQTPLQQQIAGLLKAAPSAPAQGEPLALIVPDTNLLSGGAVAATVYKSLEGRSFETVIVIAPSHTGAFQRLTICSLDTYRTPLGDLEINDRVRNELCDEDDDIFLDDTGHFHIEGIDVQLPFLQTVLPPFNLVPIVMGEETPELCKELGHAVGEVMYNRPTLVIACADVLDASPEAMAEFQGYFEACDVPRLMRLLNSETVLLKGKGAVLVAMIAALHRRANQATVLGMQLPGEHEPGFIGARLERQ